MISIRRNLILVIIAAMTLVSFYTALQGYRASMIQANSLFDTELQSYAAWLKIAADKQGVLTMPQDSTIAFQVFKGDRLYYRSDNAPEQPINPLFEGFKDRNFSRARWRTFTQHFALIDLWVVVAQRADKRFELAEKITLASVYPTVLSLPVMAVLIWLIVNRGMLPLKSITEQLKHKRADDLNPVQIKRTPLELTQIVETLNALFTRLEDSFSREKRFASDAAHELKTPLSVLKIHAYNLAQGNAGAKDIEQFNDGVERMSHVIDQILMLYRTTEQQFSAALQATDLFALCQQSIAEVYPQIDNKDQRIELTGDHCFVMAQPFSFNTMLVNLISNASKYTPANGEICLHIEQQGQLAVLSVEDSGPGIDEQLRQRVFERFYRVGGDRHNSGIQGCGLGLSIVAQIAKLHGAMLDLSDSKFASGLKVTVTLRSIESVEEAG